MFQDLRSSPKSRVPIVRLCIVSLEQVSEIRIILDANRMPANLDSCALQGYIVKSNDLNVPILHLTRTCLRISETLAYIILNRFSSSNHILILL